MSRRIINTLLPWLLMLVVATTLWASQGLQPAPFAFGPLTGIVNQGPVCPGDTLHWKSTVIIGSAPLVARRTETLWSVTKGRTIVPETAPRYTIWTAPGSITQDVSYVVPKVPADVYQVRVAGEVQGAKPAVYVVPFVLRKDCP